MKRSALTFLLFMALLFLSSGAQAATVDHEATTVGSACGSSATPPTGAYASAPDWDSLFQCNGSTWQRGAYFFGASSSTCDTNHAGLTQWTGSALQYCNGSSWTAIGTASSSNSVDPYASSVVSLLHFDGSLSDDTGKTWTANGGAGATNVGAKFGKGSLYLNGSGQDIHTTMSSDFNFGGGNFTIDWWEFRTKTSNPSGAIFAIESSDIDPSSYNASIVVGWIEGGALGFFASSSGSGWDISGGLSMGGAVANAWTHYALVRYGNTFYTFQNGVLIGTVASSSSIYYNASYLVYIGARNISYVGGYIDELRVTKGIARWTSTFPPPNQAFYLQ